MFKYFDVFWQDLTEHNILQKEGEWKAFLDFLSFKKNNNYCLEIGVNSGATSFSFAMLFNQVIGIDTERHPALAKLEKRMPNFKLILGNSRDKEIIETIKNMNIKFDLIFIDGDHSYNGVRADFYNYIEFLNLHGIIALHDIVDSKFHRDNNCNVSEFWHELQNDDRFYVTEIITDTQETRTGKGCQWINDVDSKSWGGLGLVRIK